MKLFLVIFSLGVAAVRADDCADLEAFCGNEFATACQTYYCEYDSASDGSDDEDFKNGMLRAHNQYRSQPYTKTGEDIYGGNMLEVSWDESLAATALIWATRMCGQDDGLTDAHDKCRAVKRYSSVGQNAAWAAGGSLNKVDPDANAVKGWFDEVKDFNHTEYFDNFVFEYSTGHYSQVMWADTYKIGCAYVTLPHVEYGYQAWIYCNYAVAGNMQGAQMLKQSSSLGTDCPTPGSEAGGDYGLCVVSSNEDEIRNTLGIQEVPSSE